MYFKLSREMFFFIRSIQATEKLYYVSEALVQYVFALIYCLI